MPLCCENNKMKEIKAKIISNRVILLKPEFLIYAQRKRTQQRTQESIGNIGYYTMHICIYDQHHNYVFTTKMLINSKLSRIGART